jgi:DinB superfamily
MPAVTTREDAVRLLEDQHAELAGLLAGLDEDAFVRRGTIGGGDWSAKDLAAHLGSWEEFSLETIDAFGRGERPPVEDRFTETGDGDRVNAEGVERFLDTPARDVLERFEDLHRRVIAAIGSTSDEAWTAEYPFDPDDRTLGDRIGSLLGSEDGGFRHPSAHLPDLRAYVAAISR